MCAKAAYPIFKRGGGGKIINIGSMMSIFGASFAPAYAASKGGIVQLTRSLASAWARDNIQANAVLPGWIDTRIGQARPTATPQVQQQTSAPGDKRRLPSWIDS
jgi:2-dehydro-3-deoxy-D-gluconate 5-dehydrogenase